MLRESGDVAFEDGWISLRIGMAAVTTFLLQKVDEAKAEERHADKLRFEEMKKRDEVTTRFMALRQALVDALGDRVAEIAEKAA